MQNEREALLPVVDQLYKSDEKESAENNVSLNTITEKMAEEENEIVLWIYGQTTQLCADWKRSG